MSYRLISIVLRALSELLPTVIASNPSSSAGRGGAGEVEESRARRVEGRSSIPEAYCFECATMHLGVAKVLLREAVERFDRGGPKEVIEEKVRRAYEELLGAEDDLRSVSDPRVKELHNKVEDLRKWVYRSGLLASPSKELVAEALSRLSKISEEVYEEVEARKEKLLLGLKKLKERIEEVERRLASQREAAPQAAQAPQPQATGRP